MTRIKKMNTTTRMMTATLGLALLASTAHAAVISEWTFNTGANSTDRLASSSVASGASVSGLAINASFDDFGPGVVPSGNNDGFGFGGNSGEQVIFWHRATSGTPSTWGNPGGLGANTTVANSPMSFTVTAGAFTEVTIDSISIDAITPNTAAYIVHFQEAGATPANPGVTGNGGNAFDITVSANSGPIVIDAGTSKTFTVNWNSGAFDSTHLINGLSLNGSTVSVPTPAALPAGLGLIVMVAARRRRR